MENDEFYLFTLRLSALVPMTLFEKTKPICRPLAGNPKHEVRNPKRVELVLFEKTKPIYRSTNLRNYLNSNDLWKCIRFWAAKNKANSKPNLFSPQISLGVEKTKPIISFRVRRSEFSVKMRTWDLKKQSQFANGRNKRKCLCES